jgi:hypothetical protein
MSEQHARAERHPPLNNWLQFSAGGSSREVVDLGEVDIPVPEPPLLEPALELRVQLPTRVTFLPITRTVRPDATRDMKRSARPDIYSLAAALWWHQAGMSPAARRTFLLAFTLKRCWPRGSGRRGHPANSFTAQAHAHGASVASLAVELHEGENVTRKRIQAGNDALRYSTGDGSDWRIAVADPAVSAELLGVAPARIAPEPKDPNHDFDLLWAGDDYALQRRDALERVTKALRSGGRRRR